MPTTAATPALQPIPALIKDRAPRVIETLGEPWATLGAESRRLFAEAVKIRSAYDSSDRAINEARAKDSEALADAARNGKPDPGRKHEMQVLVEQETAHNQALGATLASNTAIGDVAAAIKGDEGAKAQEALEARISEKQETVADHARKARHAIADITADAGMIELLANVRAGKVYGTISHLTERPARVPAPGGQPVDAIAVLQQIEEFVPQIELP